MRSRSSRCRRTRTKRRSSGDPNHDSGVVVEGPPGTGKTHTIANLVSALLARGQRILVTSETLRRGRQMTLKRGLYLLRLVRGGSDR